MRFLLDSIDGEWVLSGDEAGGNFSLQRTFPDGTDVVLYVEKTHDDYLIKSSAESRTSGPNEATIGTFSTLEKVKEVLLQECIDWANHLSTNGKPDLNDFFCV